MSKSNMQFAHYDGEFIIVTDHLLQPPELDMFEDTVTVVIFKNNEEIAVSGPYIIVDGKNYLIKYTCETHTWPEADVLHEAKGEIRPSTIVPSRHVPSDINHAIREAREGHISKILINEYGKLNIDCIRSIHTIFYVSSCRDTIEDVSFPSERTLKFVTARLNMVLGVTDDNEIITARFTKEEGFTKITNYGRMIDLQGAAIKFPRIYTFDGETIRKYFMRDYGLELVTSISGVICSNVVIMLGKKCIKSACNVDE